MKFNELLNQHIAQIGCTAKELSEKSGIAPASLSRYRAGERMPDYKQLKKLLHGLEVLAEEHGISTINDKTLQSSFADVLTEASFDYEQFTEKLNMLLSELDISVSELSRALNFDASYLSRIRLGQRRPSDRDGFIRGVCQYVIRKRVLADIAKLTGNKPEDMETETAGLQCLYRWLSSGVTETTDYMDDFLKKLDTFDLDEYIRAIHFDELKVPSVPFQLPTAKRYYGVEAMKQGELDFFKTTVLSKSKKNVFMCSDMPMEDMGEDVDFGKKWMFGIAMMLKKGLHLNIIHNVDRPFKEMMLGLESWIPIYMTGQVSPYYLKGKHNSVYCHFMYVSGQAALSGECVQGYHDEGQYYLTNKTDEVSYFQKRADRLLTKAQPLMEIYRRDMEKRFSAFQQEDALVPGTRRNILSSLPIYTLPKEQLTKILKRHGVYEKDGKKIMNFAEKQRQLAETMLKSGSMLDEVPLLSREEFEKYPMVLSLSGAFYENELCYTYEEYLLHLEAAKQYEECHPGYSVKVDASHVFRHIQIQIHEGKWVMVSKNKAPVIHFVIRHPLMLNAFENFVAPVVEGE